jgi:hypothetical protein
MRKITALLFILALLSIPACKGGDVTTTPLPPSPPPSAACLEGIRWNWMNLSQYDDGSIQAVLGFKVYASTSPNFSSDNLVTVDVGYVTEARWSALDLPEGEWYVSVSAYDAKGETGRNIEKHVKNSAGCFSRI